MFDDLRRASSCVLVSLFCVAACSEDAVSDPHTAPAPATDMTVDGGRVEPDPQDAATPPPHPDGGSAEARLASLVPSVGSLEPAFDPSVTSYRLVGSVGARSSFASGEALSITATTLAPSGTLRVNDIAVQSGAPSPAVVYDAGAHRLQIAVLAPNGTTTGTYSIEIEAAVSTYVKSRSTSAAVSFGTVVAASGDTLIVGAPMDGAGVHATTGSDPDDTSAAGSGAVYVFVREQGAWREQAYLKASNSRAGAAFGSAVALSGDRLVVGAPIESSAATGVGGDQADTSAEYAGAAYVFVREGNAWRQEAYLKASNTRTGAYDQFGTSVAISGDTVLVGAYGEASNAIGIDGDQADTSEFYAGAAYVFVRDGGAWRQQAYLKAATARSNTMFGQSVSLSGDTAVIGAPGDASSAIGVGGDPTNVAPSPDTAWQAGAAYVFARSNGTWSNQAYLKASNPSRYASMGHAVAIDGDAIVVGAPYETSDARGVNGVGTPEIAIQSAGAAYVFSRQNGSWQQPTYLKASNTSRLGEGARFGTSVAVSAGRVVVGAPGEWSRSKGIDGEQTNTGSGRSGAAYVFLQEATGWRQQSYVKASNPRSLADFGMSVALSGPRLIVGSPNESSAAIGIGGEQGSTSLPGSGAIYIY